LEVLSLLRGRFRMAVVTTSRREHFELMHQRSNLSQFFEFAVTREDYKRSKPDPEPYLTALRRLRLSAKQCIAIEDSERGLVAANAAGLPCIAIPSSMTKDGAFGDAAMIVPNAAALSDALRRFV
jgi:beta-phosphoglucomutase-like phosphatase (HAD superfamily)